MANTDQLWGDRRAAWSKPVRGWKRGAESARRGTHHEGGVVIGAVAGHAGDDAGALRG